MAQNTNGIYPLVANFSWKTTDGDGGSAGAWKTANTAMDGSGTVLTVFTADATNGSWLSGINLSPAGTNIASLARVFINDGTSQTSNGTHSILYREQALPVSTLSQTAAMQAIYIPINKYIPAGYKIQLTLGTTVAAGYYASADGGNY
jgi:hypothetical protein